MTPAEVAQLTATVTLITAVVSSITALTVTLIGLYLGRRFGKDADVRRWQREDEARRQVRAEELAREGYELVVQATDSLGWNAGFARGDILLEATKTKRRTWQPPANAEILPFAVRIRRVAMEVTDPQVARHFRRVADILPNHSTIHEWGGGHPSVVASIVQGSTEEVVGAFLTGRDVPIATDMDAPMKVLDDFWEQQRQDDEEQAAFQEEERKAQAEAKARVLADAAAKEAAPTPTD